MTTTRTLLPALALLALSGCFSNVETEFPAGLEPWEVPNEAEPPESDGDPHPEAISFLRKRYMRVHAVHARAYVHADVATTFAAVRHPLAGADRRPSVDFTYEEDVDPEYEHSHQSHLVVPDIVTVEMKLDWRSSAVETDGAGAPTVTATRWQKTWGSSAITLLEGSVICRRVNDEVTELEIQYHLDAIAQGWDTIEDYLTKYFASILLLAHGVAPEDLPPQ